jgi:hypothetical protein
VFGQLAGGFVAVLQRPSTLPQNKPLLEVFKMLGIVTFPFERRAMVYFFAINFWGAI